jgi:hypothetical protein
MYIEWQPLALRHLYVTCPARVKSQKGGSSTLFRFGWGKARDSVGKSSRTLEPASFSPAPGLVPPSLGPSIYGLLAGYWRAAAVGLLFILWRAAHKSGTVLP